MFGSAFMFPVRYEASRCMAIMNSVTFRAPRCSVSERFQMRPRTSFGSLAFSKISFAFSPVHVSLVRCHDSVHSIRLLIHFNGVIQATYQRARH